MKTDQMLAVFVNTSDGFHDCWTAFFHLFSRFGGCLRDRPIYLNTERLDFTSAGRGVMATKVWPTGETKRPTWSQCLRRGIEAIREPYLVYLQEDYFLKGHVDDYMVSHALKLIEADPSIGVVYLNTFGPAFTKYNSYDEHLLEIQPPCRYLASTQAAIWRKDFLLSLVRDWENGWMFEIFASRRAATAPYRFLTVKPNVGNAAQAVDYVYTGIMKGKWNKECAPLFEEHDIAMNFSRRGLYSNQGRLKSRYEVGRKLGRNPAALMRSLATIRPRHRTHEHLVPLSRAGDAEQ